MVRIMASSISQLLARSDVCLIFPLNPIPCVLMLAPLCAQGKILEVSRGIECRDLREPLGVVACLVVSRLVRHGHRVVCLGLDRRFPWYRFGCCSCRHRCYLLLLCCTLCPLFCVALAITSHLP